MFVIPSTTLSPRQPEKCLTGLLRIILAMFASWRAAPGFLSSGFLPPAAWLSLAISRQREPWTAEWLSLASSLLLE